MAAVLIQVMKKQSNRDRASNCDVGLRLAGGMGHPENVSRVTDSRVYQRRKGQHVRPSPGDPVVDRVKPRARSRTYLIQKDNILTIHARQMV